MPVDDLVDAEGAQQLGDALGGAVDVVAQLGVFVEVAAPGGDLGVKVGNTVDDRHAGTLPAGCAGRQPATGCPSASRFGMGGPQSEPPPMKILVAVKRVVDHNVRIRVRPDGTGVETENVRMSMNPFDKHAVEAAVQLVEAGHATEIVVVSIGPKQATDVILTALAMGAHRGVLIETDAKVETLAVAKLLAKVVAGGEAGPRAARQAGGGRRQQSCGADARGTARLAAGDVCVGDRGDGCGARGDARGGFRDA